MHGIDSDHFCLANGVQLSFARVRIVFILSIGVRRGFRKTIRPGTTTLTSVPEFAELAIASRAPMRSARSRMPCNHLGPWGKSRSIFRVARSVDGASSADPAPDSPERKASQVEHGAPVRLLVPVKLGLKNIKAITRMSYTKGEPADDWAKRGYSRYDGI